jgi:hypothetical protein
VVDDVVDLLGELADGIDWRIHACGVPARTLLDTWGPKVPETECLWRRRSRSWGPAARHGRGATI